MSQSRPTHILLVEDYDPERELTAAVARGSRLPRQHRAKWCLDARFLPTLDRVDAIVLDAVRRERMARRLLVMPRTFDFPSP
jgi:hypothetical protein